MIHTEAKYIQMGYKYEKATEPSQARAVAEIIRRMIEAEAVEDRAEARRLIEQGRTEARTFSLKGRTPCFPFALHDTRENRKTFP